MSLIPESHIEIETAPGLSELCAHEIRSINPVDLTTGIDYVRFTHTGSIIPILGLKTAVSAYALLTFEVPRPRALLGHEHFTRLMKTINAVINSSQAAYQTFNISAAGSDSSVMQRIKTEIARSTGLRNNETGGDLFLRIRRNKPYWDILVRLTPRPLSTRDWRVCNYEGALNAPVAYAMALLSHPTSDQTVLNIGCGSASIMIERLAAASAARVIGVDNVPQTLAFAQSNLDAANQRQNTTLIEADAIQMPFDNETIDSLLADLPFGQRVGSHETNQVLYPALIREAARVARQNAHFVLITHEIQLMQNILSNDELWTLEKELRITLRGLHPRIYVLRKI